MVLDKYVNPKLLRTKPKYAVLTALFFILLGFVSSMLVFSSEISVVMVAFSSLLILPYVVKIFEFDELDVDIEGSSKAELKEWVTKCLRDGFSPQQIKDNLIKDNLDKIDYLMIDLGVIDEVKDEYLHYSNPFSRHRKTIEFYVYLFVGMFLGYAILYSILPPELVSHVFNNQLDVLRPGPRGFFSGTNLFWPIVKNNLIITLVCVILSLLYGSGAIFILNYNASIAGVLYGSSVRAILGAGQGFLSSPYSFVPHTVIEILAYLFAAIAGAILSKAAMGVLPGNPKILMKDGLLYLTVAIILIFIGASVEVTVPFMFM
ncbi:MAG: stage II sporulation protein M [Candidatus Altiarchaeota archaeon]